MYQRARREPAVECHPEAVRMVFRQAFLELASDEEFLALETFKEQAIFAKDFLENSPSVNTKVPNACRDRLEGASPQREGGEAGCAGEGAQTPQRRASCQGEARRQEAPRAR